MTEEGLRARPVGTESRGIVADRAVRLGLRLWAAITAIVCGGIGLLMSLMGDPGFRILARQGPRSRIMITLIALAAVWVALGVALAALRRREFRAGRGLSVACSCLIVLLYANVMRETITTGDSRDYIGAAQNLARGEAIHGRYLYPPLLATVLAPLLPLGVQGILGVLTAANLAALGLFTVLLTALLERYGFGRRQSCLLTCGFLTVNVPLLRTLVYHQVNIHAGNLILLALLCYPRAPAASAAALALAVHLKFSPIVLALPFLLRRDWRWCGWFAVLLAGFAAVTAAPYGWQPFGDFLHNVSRVYAANRLQFRETSFDSLFRNAAFILGMPLGAAFWPTLIAKGCLLAAVLVGMRRAVRNAVFVRESRASDTVLNSIPVLSLFMLLGSPLVWEHHPVLVAVPYLVLLKRLETPAEWAVYGAAYATEYLLPTFDIFPLSFVRLLSPLVLLALVIRTSGAREQSTWWRGEGSCARETDLPGRAARGGVPSGSTGQDTARNP